MMYFVRGIFLFVMAMVIFVTANAETLCVRDDTVMVVLAPEYDGTASSGSATNMTWTATFSYGKVSGTAVCKKEQQDGTMAGQNQVCWCQMTKPVVSKLLYNTIYGSANQCLGDCATACGNNFKSSASSLRSRIYASVGK